MLRRKKLLLPKNHQKINNFLQPNIVGQDDDQIMNDGESGNNEDDFDEQDSSTEETDFDDEAIKEAEVGGSDILPVSSTSKLSANAEIPESDFIAMQESDPTVALSLLLTRKRAQSQTSSEQTQSRKCPFEKIRQRCKTYVVWPRMIFTVMAQCYF
jgi:hypothetical protein